MATKMATDPAECPTPPSSQVQANAAEPILALRGVTKRFGGATALDGVDFDLLPGEIHGLVGENGAGKSTLMKILSGVHAPDEGELVLRGERVRFSSPAGVNGRLKRLSWASVDEQSGPRPLEANESGSSLPATFARHRPRRYLAPEQ